MAQKPRRSCFKVSPLAFFLLFFQFGQAQYDFSALDTKLQQYQKQLGGSVVTLVYKDGKVVYTKKQGVDFDGITAAPIGGASGWLTAALVMTFVDDGKLKLTDRVSTFIPIFERYSKTYITVQDCLSNLAGIEEPGGLPSASKMVYNSLEEEATAIASKLDIIAQPGKEFRYGSVGLNILGRIIELVGKRDFEQLMQQRILRPLGMKGTTFQSDYDRAPNPTGGASSTANDYMNFLSMILNKGVFKGKRILSENAIAQMQQMQITQAAIKSQPKASVGFGYGFGEWLIEQDANGKGICVAAPSFVGTWPMVDNCRGYATIIFVKDNLGEQKKDIYMDLKSTLDDIFPCK